jgi:3-phenylpropionate/cinnamic acid dioxygenase small subunit
MHRMVAILVLTILSGCAAPAGIREYSGRSSLEHLREIEDLMYRYAETADTFDAEGWTSLFLPDAVLIGYNGKGDIRRHLTSNAQRLEAMSFRNERLQSDGIQSRHFISNCRISHRAEGEAKASCQFLVSWQYPAEPTPRIVHSGKYVCVVVETDAGWRFARSEAYLDHD